MGAKDQGCGLAQPILVNVVHTIGSEHRPTDLSSHGWFDGFWLATNQLVSPVKLIVATLNNGT